LFVVQKTTKKMLVFFVIWFPDPKAGVSLVFFAPADGEIAGLRQSRFPRPASLLKWRSPPGRWSRRGYRVDVVIGPFLSENSGGVFIYLDQMNMRRCSAKGVFAFSVLLSLSCLAVGVVDSSVGFKLRRPPRPQRRPPRRAADQSSDLT